MQCPRCKRFPLEPFRHKSSASLDVCRHCLGFWFDKDELDLVLDVVAKDLRPPREGDQHPAALCPKCHLPMVPFRYPQTQAMVDMCRECHGLWLDRGEYEQIRDARRTLREQNRLQEFAPIRGIKGTLLRYVNSAIGQLTSWE